MYLGMPEGPHHVYRVDWGDMAHGPDWVMLWEADGVWYIVHDRFPGLLHEIDAPEMLAAQRVVMRHERPEVYLSRMGELATTDTVWHSDAWRDLLWKFGLRSRDGTYPATKSDVAKMRHNTRLGPEG